MKKFIAMYKSIEEQVVAEVILEAASERAAKHIANGKPEATAEGVVFVDVIPKCGGCMGCAGCSGRRIR